MMSLSPIFVFVVLASFSTSSAITPAELRQSFEEAFDYGKVLGSLELDVAEESMAPMFQVVPKNQFSRVDVKDAAWLLQRYVVQRHNWHLSGTSKERFGQPAVGGEHLWLEELLAELNPSGRGFNNFELSKAAVALERLLGNDIEATSNLTEQARQACTKKREALLQLGQQRGGRVPIDIFSGIEVGALVSEDISLLKESGAIVEVGEKPYLLVANYMLLPSQCVATGKHHSVCCASDGETFLKNLELMVAGPSPSWTELLAIIPGLASEHLQGQHKFTRKLADELQKMGEENGGFVDFHGEAFAIWLHAAFPTFFPLPWPAREHRQVFASQVREQAIQLPDIRELMLMTVAFCFAIYRYVASSLRGAKPAPPSAAEETVPAKGDDVVESTKTK